MHIKKHLAFLALIIIAVSCKKKPVETDNIFKYRDYISYTTSGVVSVKSPIKINLAEAVEGWEAEQELNAGLISTQPHIQGTLKALSKHTLLFTPDESLEPATAYGVTVKLGDIYKTIPAEFKNYTFEFKTITPSFSINTNSLQSYSKEWQYVLGQLRSSDVITLEDAKQLVSAKQNKKDLSIVWLEVPEPTRYF
jgi:hypothetical protein